MQIHYGGDQTRWLHMPTGVILAFVRGLPALVAEECMRGAQIIGVGTGNIAKSDRNRILRDWAEDARGQQETRKPTPDERKALMRAVGIKHG